MKFSKLMLVAMFALTASFAAIAQNTPSSSAAGGTANPPPAATASAQTNAPTVTPAPSTPPDTAAQDDKAQMDKMDKNAPPAAKDPVEPSQTTPKVKQGSKNDVDAIGNREIGKRGLGNWYSLDSEIREGKQYSQEIEATLKLVQDPVVTEYVNRIGQNLVRNSDAKVPFTIKVVDSDEINAFALPGGYFYVNSGLILAADEEAELAGVMAHEIAHVAARHYARQKTRSNMANLATIPLIFVGGGLGYGLYEAAGIGIPLTFLHFSREFEAEADYLGLQYMYKSGYDPNAFVTFFEKVQAKEKKKPGTLSKAFSTHPPTPDRIEHTQEEIAKVLPAREQYVVTTSEFDDVKARLAQLENRRKVFDEKDKNRPTLRRTSTADKSGTGTTNDDDRPTLSRRKDGN